MLGSFQHEQHNLNTITVDKNSMLETQYQHTTLKHI